MASLRYEHKKMPLSAAITNAPKIKNNNAQEKQKLATGFPAELYAMLEEAEKQGCSPVVSWQPSGKSFKIHRPHDFQNLMSAMGFFKQQTKYKSFIRQLNKYGFSRIHTGPNIGGYQHKDFIRGQPNLCAFIKRGLRNQTPGFFREMVRV